MLTFKTYLKVIKRSESLIRTIYNKSQCIVDVSNILQYAYLSIFKSRYFFLDNQIALLRKEKKCSWLKDRLSHW